MKQDLIQPEDYKYYVSTPDPDFSPARNKAVIQKSIEDTDRYFALLHKATMDGIAERIDILSSYAVNRLSGRSTMSFKDYVGKDLHEKLIGEKIMEKIRILEATNKLSGRNDKFIQL